MRRFVWALPLLLLGCGSGLPEAETAEEPGPEPASEEAPSDSPPREAEPASEGETASSATTPDATPEERKTILQLVIDNEELDQQLNLGTAGRFPLKVAGDDIPDGLTKMTKPVELVTDPAPDAPVLVFTEIDVKPPKATVRFRYGAEGIKGTAILEKSDHGWQVVNTRFVER